MFVNEIFKIVASFSNVKVIIVGFHVLPNCVKERTTSITVSCKLLLEERSKLIEYTQTCIQVSYKQSYFINQIQDKLIYWYIGMQYQSRKRHGYNNYEIKSEITIFFLQIKQNLEKVCLICVCINNIPQHQHSRAHAQLHIQEENCLFSDLLIE